LTILIDWEIYEDHIGKRQGKGDEILKKKKKPKDATF